eukprot:TRINITY_DN12850_c0_g1_i3.p1 TRINITY_DN12850_c0_g1~~TRINITY_DN12850_c0_g1_i3.p1  ORF type:complete len:301 (-),score=60.90 TRINITY_DN12850_c0_g1_i3:243-1145(-)
MHPAGGVHVVYLTSLSRRRYVVVGIGWYKYNHPGTFMCNPLPEQDSELTWLFWVFYAQKYWEFLDTWVFILRCSFRQVSVLHLFHHSSITVVVGTIMMYDYGGDMFLPILLNAIVHTMMYSHYLCTVFKIKTWWNQYLTMLQIIQFLLITSQNLLSYQAGTACGPPDWAKLLMIGYMGSMLVLFGNFFLRKYVLGKNDSSMCGVLKVNSDVTWTTYRGLCRLDSDGVARVELPGFQSRHKYAECQYQLTAVGSRMPDLHVSMELEPSGVFGVDGGVKNGTVSWQVMAADQMLENTKEKQN